jgi:hypothetical protein
MTGQDIAYIYANAKLALLGTFEKNKMISARKARVTGGVCENSLLMLDIQLVKDDPMQYHYSHPSNDSVGDAPLTPDPYEAETVHLASSTFTGAGHGLFASRDIKKGELLSFYNGFQFFGQKERQVHDAHCLKITPGIQKREI